MLNKSQNTLGISEITSFCMPYIFGKKWQRKRQFAEGIIRVRRLPDGWTDEEYAHWWLPTTDSRGKIIIPARMSEREKDKYGEAEAHNQIMAAGRTAALSYIGSPSGSTTQWAQEFAVGTGAITSVTPLDTTLANETFRKSPVSYSVAGSQVDINIQFGTSEAQYTYTNAGLFGNSATSTLSSGTMMTHAFFSYTKGAFSISVDYIINLL
jgi:hypothetical protein